MASKVLEERMADWAEEYLKYQESGPPPKIPMFRVAMSPHAARLVGNVLSSGYVGQGDMVDKFERSLASVLRSIQLPITTNSGTAALDLALHLCGVEKGTNVVSTPMTCTASNGVIANRGAHIIWADVDPETGLIDPEDVARKVDRRTKAIMAVDWSGRPAAYHELKQFGVPVIQDAAHSFLAKNGIGGDYVCWSFQAIKHLTTGDGGALLPPKEMDQRARLLRWYGLDRKSSTFFRCEQNIQEIGYKYHMNNINAAIGLANLDLAQSIVDQHRANAQFYENNLRITGKPFPSFTSSWWTYHLLMDERDEFQRFMDARGIETGRVHMRNDVHDAFARVSSGGSLPGVDYYDSHQIAIPVGWWLTQNDLRTISDTVNEWHDAH
jgi:dTDP-4-amino-4,6-dideoxygalactose transaminase